MDAASPVKGCDVMITISQLKKEFDSRLIFDHLNLEITEGEILGIVGPNGAGKTTLVELIAGRIKPDGGMIRLEEYTSIAYMEQVDITEKESTLSGGELTKKRIQEAFEGYSQLLILDEPTNHLDFKGILWLKRLIQQYYGTVIVISHDRYFMDLVCTSIFEIDNRKGIKYSGNYSDYYMEKERRVKSQQLAYEKQEKYKAKIQEDIKTLKQWSEKAHRQSTKKVESVGIKMGTKEFFRKKAKKKDAAIKSRIKRLEKIEVNGVDKPEEALNIKFRFDKENSRHHQVIICEGVSKSFGSKRLFQDVNVTVNRGERIGLLGLNGTGKTTFIKILQGEVEADEGRVRIPNSLKVGYLSQEVLDLDENQTILESLGFHQKEDITIARIQLNNLGITKEMIHQKVGTLSMGERTRIKLAKIVLSDYDILILDEPTNHLDIATRETLENALTQYKGTLIVVSHDYYMMGQLCEDTLVIEKNQMTRTYHSPTEYLDGFMGSYQNL
jgi:macrolide transport system ATP-binding/permease protein